ncbi:MAG: helix-turn-helix transcriptional regulator [Kibdelosporangium sp.]
MSWQNQQQQLPAPVMKIVLGHELRRLRTVAGLTQEEVATVLHCSQQKVDYFERGGGVRFVELKELFETYRVADTDRAYAMELHAESDRRAKRGGFRSRFRQHLRLLVDMEPTCHRLYSYRGMVVPGLLQTEDYMRTLFRAWRPAPTPDQIDLDTVARLARQEVLDDAGRDFWFIVDEAVLRRTAGSCQSMKAQVLRLVEVIDRPNVELQLVPFSAGYYMGQAHDYTIFGYNVEPHVDIVYRDQHDGGEYVDDTKRTPKYVTLWEQQKAAALGPEQTRCVLLELAKSL